MLCTYRVQKPSRSELQVLLGQLQTKIAFVKDEIAFLKSTNPKLDHYIKVLEDRKNANTASLKRTANSYISKELECSAQISNATTSRNSCAEVSTLMDELDQSIYKEADSVANAGGYKWGNATKTTYIKKLLGKLDELKRQKQVAYGLLGTVDPLVGSIARSNRDAIDAVINSKKEDNWLKFEFKSEDYQKGTRSTSYSIKTGATIAGGYSPALGWSNFGSTSHHYSKSKQEFDEAMVQASFNVKGKLLRVHIKRPWFKPEIFDDRNLDFVSCLKGDIATLC